jgi:hypothetical protein
MAKRWLKSDVSPINTSPFQYQHLYWYLAIVCGFTVVDILGAFASSGNGTGSIGLGSVTTFTATTGTSFTGTTGKYLVVRDDQVPANSGIYYINSVTSPTVIEVNASFVGPSSSITWYVINTVSTNDGDYFVIQNAPNASASYVPWQCKVQFHLASFAYVTFEFNARGTWNASTHAWGTNPAPLVYLGENRLTLYGVGDDSQGSFVVWNEDGTGHKTMVSCGSFAPLHSPPGSVAPRELYPASIWGASSSSATNVDRLAFTGYVLDSTQFAYTAVNLVRYHNMDSGNDPLSTAFSAINPRSNQLDSYTATLYSVDGGHAVLHGNLALVRTINDNIANGTLVSGGAFFAVQNGLCAAWDKGLWK